MVPINSDSLLVEGESLYTVIVVAARRARQLLEGSEPLVESESIKPVSIAFEEIRAGKVKWTKTKSTD